MNNDDNNLIFPSNNLRYPAMKMKENAVVLFPSEYDNLNKIDEEYAEEQSMCKKYNIEIALYDHDKFVNEGIFKSTLNLHSDREIIIRSWMLSEKEYTEIEKKVTKFDYILAVTSEQYLHCHYFPRVYKEIEEFTPNTIWFDDLSTENLKEIHSNIKCDKIIKDYVKSVDTVFKIDKNISFSEFQETINKFIEERYSLFNKGIVLKDYVELDEDEIRIFVYDGEIVHVVYDGKITIPLSLVESVISNITTSTFYTIDFAKKKNTDEWLLIETGDAQVSGLKGSDTDSFYYKMKIFFAQRRLKQKFIEKGFVVNENDNTLYSYYDILTSKFEKNSSSMNIYYRGTYKTTLHTSNTNIYIEDKLNHLMKKYEREVKFKIILDNEIKI